MRALPYSDKTCAKPHRYIERLSHGDEANLLGSASALVFMYKQVLDMQPPWVENVLRPKSKIYSGGIVAC